MAAAGFSPDIRHSTDDYVVVQNLVAAGLGIALLPQLALTAAPNPRVRAVVLSDNPIRQIRLIARHEMAGTPAVRAGATRPAIKCSRDGRRLAVDALALGQLQC